MKDNDWSQPSQPGGPRGPADYSNNVCCSLDAKHVSCGDMALAPTHTAAALSAWHQPPHPDRVVVMVVVGKRFVTRAEMRPVSKQASVSWGGSGTLFYFFRRGWPLGVG